MKFNITLIFNLLLPALLLLFTLNTTAQRSGTIKIDKPATPGKGITASIAKKSGGNISKTQLLSTDIIYVNDSTKVINYDFLLTRASIKTKVSVEGNRILPEIKRYIEELRPGHIIQFKDILCRDKNGLTFRVYDIQFQIIESNYSKKGTWTY